ncbi:Acg family FMN-binding oxidoreductase [Arthrobacter sp. CG_A4]|uniref:Acg family FMN-binding oxidoreductase n=1 Tax=Arthrobacter sp. CG_A4 TaxID=3071706 RepID=UPI002DFC70F3|nr:hypothetical protein [Arthrobacter sp. CG_A4]
MSQRRVYDHTAALLRQPDPHSTVSLELIRLASLAASSHNTQPWKFLVTPDAITIQPDRTRSCAVVDPDDAHLFKSLGCAAENLVQAANARGQAAEVSFDPAGQVIVVRLKPSSTLGPTPLSAAIETRQCTRGTYDGQPVSSEDLAALKQAGSIEGVQCILLCDRGQIDTVAGFVTRGNLTQLNNNAFRRELVSWIRFNPAAALRRGDGLAGLTTDQPPIPTPVGKLFSRALIRAGAQAQNDAEHIASSPGVAIFATTGNDARSWVAAGRAYQRFALQAEALDIRSAFVNQPIEVPGLRREFESWLGLTHECAQLAVRFGHGPKLPYSLRRPVQEVLVSSSAQAGPLPGTAAT